MRLTFTVWVESLKLMTTIGGKHVGKFILEQTMKAQGKNGGIALHLL